ncbi:MAG: hypothetical protein K2L88_05890, partial [Clostridiales bacterium]|nr:hypothetical protein [Clostridiales bacterium]
DGNTYNATIAVDFSDGIKAQITAPEFGLEISIIGDTAYLSVGEIRLCGNIAEAKDLYEELRKHTELPALDAIIALPQDLDIEGIIGTVLGAIKSLEAKDGVIYANIEFDGFGAAATVNADLSEITVCTNGIAISMTPEFKSVTIDEPNGTYNSIAQFKNIIPSVFELIENTTFAMAYDMAAFGYGIDGAAILDIANGIKVNATANALGQTVSLSYIDEVVYFGLQAIQLKFDTVGANEWQQPITDLLGAFGIAMPDLSEITNELKGLSTQDILGTALTALDCVKSFTVEDGVITLNVEYGEYKANLTISIASDEDNGASVVVKLGVDGFRMDVCSLVPA